MIKKLVRYLLMGWHWPLLVRTGLRNWKAKTVPVGRSLIRFPTPVRVACAVVCGGGGLLGLDMVDGAECVCVWSFCFKCLIIFLVDVIGFIFCV